MDSNYFVTTFANKIRLMCNFVIHQKLEEAAEEDDDDDRGRLQIMDQPIDLTGFDILDEPAKRESHGLVQNDFDLNFEELS